MRRFSYCIITNAVRASKLAATLRAVRFQSGDKDIIVCGAPIKALKDVCIDDVRFVSRELAAREGRLGCMRNAAVTHAVGDLIVVMDDDIILKPGWAEAVDAHDDEWDVLATRLLNPDGTRYWDWATNGGRNGHSLLPYDRYDDHVYVTGGLSVQKPDVRILARWNDGLGFYQNEDGDFSKRLHSFGMRIRFCEKAVAVHDDPTNTQHGRWIVKKETQHDDAV